MNLELYCDVAEACRIANVSKSYMHSLITSGKVKAEKVAGVYLVLRASVQSFKRTPGMGRPKRARPVKKPATRKRRE